MKLKIDLCCYRAVIKTIFVFIFLGAGCIYANNIPDFTPLYKGVSYRLVEKNNGQLKIHQIKIDAEDPDIEIFTTPPNNENFSETTASKPSTFLRKEKAQVVMNGTGYRPANTEAEGVTKAPESLAIYNGIKYAEARGEDAAFIVLNNGTKKIVKSEELQAYEGVISMAIGAWPWKGVQGLLIDDGISLVADELENDELAARSALGISQDGKSLYFVVVQGRPRKKSIFRELMTDGVSLYSLGSIMHELGCYRAMNLDGGGSSTMVIENIINAKPLILNIPSDLKPEGERPVGSHLGIRAPYISNYEIKESTQFKTFRSLQERSAFFDLLNKSESILSDLYMDSTTYKRQDSKDITSLDKLYKYFGISPYNDFNLDYDLLLNSKGISFNDCFSEMDKYNFDCGDPKYFFDQLDFDVSNNLMKLSDLQLVGEKETGNIPEGAYMDSNKVFYFVKHAQVKNELIGSKLLNLIIGTETTPVVKLLKDHPTMIASRMIRGFKIAKDLNKENDNKKRLIGLADLSVAMDFIGLVDRNNLNMGYVEIKHRDNDKDRRLSYVQTYAAARVDYDHSFSFNPNPNILDNDPSCVSLLWMTFASDHYASLDIIPAINGILELPDSQIVMTIFECWAMLSEVGQNITLEDSFNLSSKLIDRKKSFAQVRDEVNRLNIRKSKESRKLGFVRDLSNVFDFQGNTFNLKEVEGMDKVNVLMNGVQVAQFDITDETLKAPFHFELRKKRYTVNLDKIRIDRRNFVWIDKVSFEEETQEFCHIDRN